MDCRSNAEVATLHPLAMLTAEALAAECIAAANFPTFDLEGNEALLAEAHRRRTTTLFDDQFLQMLDVALSPENTNWQTRAPFGWTNDALERAISGLRNRVTVTEPKYLFHATLKSRLGSICRHGLVAAKHPKDWGPEVSTEHLSSGVFFSVDWRTATDWVLFRTSAQLAKGAIIRLQTADLQPEKDETARRPGCFIVRKQVIDVGQAQVLLAPFSVTTEWLTLPEAVELCRRRR